MIERADAPIWLREWLDRWFAAGLSETEIERRIREVVPIVHVSEQWRVLKAWRRPPCDNLPGLKKMYVEAIDENGDPLGDVRIEFATKENNTGTIYDHKNIYGYTGTARGREGYAEWRHLGKPTWYTMWVDGVLLVERIRTDLPPEYCRKGPIWDPHGWRPINRNGIFSYDFIVQRQIEGGR